MLDKSGVIAYIGANAGRYGLDPAALLAVAEGEGLKTGPGSSWTVPGEPTFSFGPPSWYAGGAGKDFMQHFGVHTAAEASAIAWSPEGLDYWMQKAAEAGASGKTGLAAIIALVTGFERPAAQYIAGNIRNAKDAYDRFVGLIGQLPIPIPGQPSAPSAPAPSVPANPTSPGTGGTAPQDVRLGSIGPFKVGIPSGLVLGLLGLSMLVIGALMFVVGGRTRLDVGTVGGTARVVPKMRGQVI